MHGAEVQQVEESRARRVIITVAWPLLQFAILVALFYAGSLLTVVFVLAVSGGHGAGFAGPAGMLIGIAGAMAVNLRARHWLQRLRVRRLRAKGVTADGYVVKRDWDMSTGRGVMITKYTVLVRWIDPATGVRWQGRRQYRFIGMGSRDFDAACGPGAKVPVRYPPGRPSRFVIDVAFAPVMPDIV